ncbi:hypothetical protein ACFWM5_38895 [Streptomyces bobili]|uniref:hypothetical protein n=1 Tax=Streptomyces bobili TaxID=67280 RepID=UPI003669F333
MGAGQEHSLTWLRAEHDNLMIVLEYARHTASAATDRTADRSSTAQPDTAQAWLELTTALRFHWCCNGFLREGRRQFDQVLDFASEPTPARARTLWAAAWVAAMQGDHDTVDRP